MPAVVLAPPVLVCPNACGARALASAPEGVPVGGGAATMHACPTVAGMLVPMVPEGLRAEARAVEREDYEGEDHGRTRLDANGRPIASVVVQRDDRGPDVAVFAPLATVGGSA